MNRRGLSAVLAVAIAMAWLISAPAAAQEVGLYPVTDEPSGVSVALHAAATPSTQTDPASGIVVRFFLAVTGDVASSLSVFEISEATGGYDIDGGVRGSAQGSGGTLLTCAQVLQQGFPARDFVVDVTDASGNSGLIQSRLVYTGQHVVQVQALGADALTAEVQLIFDQLLSTLDVPPIPVASGEPIGSPNAGSPVPAASVQPACLV